MCATINTFTVKLEPYLYLHSSFSSLNTSACMPAMDSKHQCWLVPGIQPRLRPRLHTPSSPERCRPTTQAGNRWNVPPQVEEPLAGLKVWCPNLWERVREDGELLSRPHRGPNIVFSLTVQAAPASDVTGKAMRQRLMGIRKSCKRRVAIVKDRFS